MNALRALPRDAWLAIGLLGLLALVIGVAGTWQSRQGDQLPALSSQSTNLTGAKGLWLWLTALRYQLSNEASGEFAVPNHIGVVLLLEPSELVLEEDWLMLDKWVKEGGLLIIAGEGPFANEAFRHYAFALRTLPEVPTTTVSAYHPVLLSPAASDYPNVQVRAYLESDRTDDLVALAGIEDKTVAVVLNQQLGRVVLISTAYPFSNAGLRRAGNPEFVLSLISSGRFLADRIWFDEWHHGARGTRPVVASGPENWLRNTSAGQAVLYTAAVIFVALLLQGRRFGRPIPAPETVARRDPVEYLTALANLHRRARHRQAILHQYHQRLKRQLGKRYRLDPQLRDDDYVQRLRAINPALDAIALRQLLHRLTAPSVSEAEMVKLAAIVSEWLKELPN